jgi:hypothetical protein
MSQGQTSIFERTSPEGSLLTSRTGGFHIEHHGRQWNPQFDGLLFAIQNTRIAMPAFLGIPYLRNLLFLCHTEDIRGADIRTNTTGIALLFDDHRWHKILLHKMRLLKKLPENAHLPFGRLMALSKVEGLRYPYPPPC